MDFSKSLSVVEFSDMLRRNNMLGSYQFSPLSDLDSDSNVDEVLMLNWEDSFLTGKGNETINFLDCVPLVLWDPKCGLDLVTEEGETGDSFRRCSGAFGMGESDDQRVWYVCGFSYCLL